MAGNQKVYIVERERERERVTNSFAGESVATEHVSIKAALAFLAICLAVVGTILAIGIQNSANAAPKQVGFNALTVNNGAKFAVNSNKTLTAINNGGSVVADNVSTSAVKGNAITSSLNSFATSNYGSDRIFTNNVATNPTLLSQGDLNNHKSYLPSVSAPYWLSDTGSLGSITWQAYAKANNGSDSNSLKVTGKIDNSEYIDSEVAKGSYAFNKDLTLENFVSNGGGVWSLDSKQTADFTVCYTNIAWFKNGSEVYNNPGCYDSGDDGKGHLFKKSVIQNLYNGSGRKAFGYVSGDNNIVQVKAGQTFPAGTVLVFGFVKYWNEIKDPSGFLIPDQSVSSAYVGFIKTESPVTITANTKEKHSLYGTMKYYETGTTVNAVNITSGTNAVRPSYDFDKSNVAFVRSSTSGTTLATTSTFGNPPSVTASNGETVKAVVKSNNITITNAITSANISTERNSQLAATYADGVIKVPVNSKTLTLNSSAFTNSGPNYISALADSNGTQKYAVLGRTGTNLSIDLASILNTSQVGSSASLSFYGEMANAAGSSDAISATPVNVEIQIVQGVNQTITYNAGTGTGTVPEAATVVAGSSYAMASGSGLSKDGNPFTSWTVSYTPFGETAATSRIIGGGEAFVVPDTTNGRITATANYSGIKAGKTTDSSSTVVTVTWDTNAPDGTTAKFAADVQGDFNSARTQMYNKINRLTTSATVPGAPTDLSAGFTQMFDGWYTDPVNGTKVTGSVTPTANTTYYAHWLEGYKVTYVVTGGDGATQTGKWSDGTTTNFEELVLPESSTVGPNKGTPVADSSLYVFDGWYNSPNGAGGSFNEKGTSFDELGGSKTVYAYYVLADTFLARATNSVTANPRNISGNKYSIVQVQAEARDIATNGESSQFYSKYIEWMNGDSYHLYTLLNGQDPNQANSWLECRIIQVGQHDSDGSGITFQAIHALPNMVAYDSNYSSGDYTGNWSTSTLRTYLNDTFIATLPTSLKNRLAAVNKKSNARAGEYPVVNYEAVTTTDKLWILSFTELSINSSSSSFKYWGSGSSGHDGSIYAFWKKKSFEADSSTITEAQRSFLRSLHCDRAGDLKIPTDITTKYGYSWQRSVSPFSNSRVLILNSNGFVDSNSGNNPSLERSVVPAFSL